MTETKTVKGTGKPKAKKVKKPKLDDNAVLAAATRTPRLRAVLRQAGVPKASGLVYGKLREFAKKFLESVLSTASDYNKKKTIAPAHIAQGIERLGVKVYGYSENGDKNQNMWKSWPSCTKGMPRKFRNTAAKDAAVVKGKKGLGKRSNVGKLAFKQIQFLQKKDDCYLLQKYAFKTLVRQVLQDYEKTPGETWRITGEALVVLQGNTERMLVGYTELAILETLHGRRTTLLEKDLDIVKTIRHKNSVARLE